MTEAQEDGSEAFPVVSGPDAGEVPHTVTRACHQLIDAASALVVNLELLSAETEGETGDLVADARASIDRVVRLARSIPGLAKCACVTARPAEDAAPVTPELRTG